MSMVPHPRRVAQLIMLRLSDDVVHAVALFDTWRALPMYEDYSDQELAAVVLETIHGGAADTDEAGREA